MNRLLRPLVAAVALAPLVLGAGCGPKTTFTDADIPGINKFDNLMWAQAQATDPLWKKIGAAAFTDDEFAAAGRTAARLKLTAPRLKEKAWSKGAGFDALADQLGAKADELAAAAEAKDAGKASAALGAIKDTCKSCHKQFK